MRSKEVWLVQENHATVKRDLNVASRGMKTCSESRIELQNPQLLTLWLPTTHIGVVYGGAVGTTCDVIS